MRAFVFTDKALERQAGRFVWLSINTERPGNASVVGKFPVQAWPSFYVIDPATEKVVIRYVGGATVPQLQRILDDGVRAAGGGKTPANEALAKADALYGEGKNVEAAAAYREALKATPKTSPSYSRTVESLLFALVSSHREEECTAVAKEALPNLRGTPSFAGVAGAGLDCALGLKKDAPDRAALVAQFATDVEDILKNGRAGLAGDDVSGLFSSLADERDAAGDAAGKKKTLQEQAAFLEAEAAKAKTSEGRAVFDPHRLGVYLALGTPEKAIPMLEQSERDSPDDYNPPARLALAYRGMKKWDEALVASDRALARVYGPRKIVVLQARADIYAKKGDLAAARKTWEDALAAAEALPKEQRSERQIAFLKKQLDAPR